MGDEGLFWCGVYLMACTASVTRWLVVDALLVSVCYGSTRAVLGSRLCDQVEEWWTKECASSRLVRYAAYSLIVASITLQVTALLPLRHSTVAFVYHFRDQAALKSAGAANASVITNVEVRFVWPTLTAVQHDSVTGAALASIHSISADMQTSAALSRLLHRSQPNAQFHFTVGCVQMTWAVFICLLSLVAVFALCSWCVRERTDTHNESWETESVNTVNLCALCWLLLTLPAALCLALHAQIASQPRFTLTAVGWPPLCLYAAAVLGSAGWLLALLAWKGKQRAAMPRASGGDGDADELLQMDDI